MKYKVMKIRQHPKVGLLAEIETLLLSGYELA